MGVVKGQEQRLAGGLPQPRQHRVEVVGGSLGRSGGRRVAVQQRVEGLTDEAERQRRLPDVGLAGSGPEAADCGSALCRRLPPALAGHLNWSAALARVLRYLRRKSSKA